jgi:hypothetical protein
MDTFEGERVGRHVPDFTTFTQDVQVGHALAALEVAHAQAAQFLAPQAVVEEGGQDGPVAFAFEGVVRGRFQQRPRLAVAQRRGFALILVYFRALDPADRVVAHRVFGTAARKPPLRDPLLWATLSLAHRFKLEGILSTWVDVLPKQRGREAQKIIVDRQAFGAELADDRLDVQRIPSNDSH